MADADIYSLFMGGRDAATQAQAQAEALRRRREAANLARNAGNVALLTGDRVLTNFGQAQLQQAAQGEGEAGRGEGLLAQAGSQWAGRQLQQALANQQAAQHAADMGQRAREGALGRDLQRELAGMEDARAMAKLEADKAKAEADKGKAVRDDITGLRKEFNALPTVKDFNEIGASYAQLKQAAKNPSAVGDLGMIYGLMKMLDPGVSLMEGDVANAQNTRGIPAQMVGAYNKALSGQRLSPEQRADFLSQAEGIFGVRQTQFNRASEYYRRLASDRGGSPEDVVLDLGASPSAPASSFSLDAPQTQTNPQANADAPALMRGGDGKLYRRQPDGTYLPE